VRRMVLDSNVDPRRVWYPAQLDQDRAFDRNMNIYFAWIAKYHAVYHLGSTEKAVENLFYSVQDQLRQHPAGGIIGPDEWTDAFLGAGYYIFGWEDIASAFAAWVHDHDVKPIKAEYDSSSGIGDDNNFAVYLGVQCTDAHWPQDYARWRSDSIRVSAQAPFETWGNTWFNAPCLYWPAPEGTPLTIDGSKVKSVLLFDETLDAATPYPGSLEVRSLFPNSSLIASPGGTTHAATLFGNSCVDDQIASYLANGTRPTRVSGNRADGTCPPLPPPVPTSSSSSVTASSLATANAVLRQRLAQAILVK